MKDDAQIQAQPVATGQREPHRGLAKRVQRHCAEPWRKPTPKHSEAACEEILSWLEKYPGRPIILDSFCGTGMSTALLAAQNPTAVVIGIDKSQNRLAKHQMMKGRYMLARTDCEPLWQLLVNAGICLHEHYLLYPNPWPKPAQLQRRVHGHPAFPLLRTLGGNIELRSNWQIYAEEFQIACEVLGLSARLDSVPDASPLTLFEKKYRDRGHSLWRVRAQGPN